MRNFVDLSNTNDRKRIVTLLPSLTKDDSIVVGSTPFRFSDYSGCFTQYVPATCNVINDNEISSNDSVVVSDSVAFRLGYYTNLDIARQYIKEGVGCIVVNNTNQPSIFHVDGLKFNVTAEEDPSVQAYIVNMASGSTVKTAENIATEISKYCINVTAYSRGNCVILKSRYLNNVIYGNVASIVDITLSGMAETDTSTQIGNNNNRWTFVCSISGEESINESTHTITFARGANKVETLTNFQNAINEYAKVTNLCYAKTTIENGVIHLLVYLCNISYSVVSTNPFIVNSSRFVGASQSVSVVTIDSDNGTLKSIPLYNLYSNEADAIVQMASCLIVNDPESAISKIVINNNGLSINIEPNKVFNMYSYSNFIYCSLEQEKPSTAIISNCVDALYQAMSSEDISSTIFGENSLKISSNASEYSCTSNIVVSSIGSNEYPSSDNDPMGIADFNDIISSNREIEVCFLKSGNSSTTIPIQRDINIDIIGSGNVLKLNHPLLSFQGYVNVKLHNFQIDWDSDGDDAVFDFEYCQGSISILNSEVYFRRTGHFVKTNYCLNFTISNKNSSYLLSNVSSSNLLLFNIVNSSVNLISNDNVIDTSAHSGFFYSKNNSFINTNGTGKDIIRRNSENFNYSLDFNREPFVYGLNDPYSKLLCGVGQNNELADWSFNLTCNSAALNFDYDTNAPADIFGRKRGFTKAFGKNILSLSNDTFVAVSDDNYIVLGENKFYFTKAYKKHSDIVNTERLVKAIVECVSYNSNYKIEAVPFVSNNRVSAYNLIIYGDIISVDVSYGLKNLVISNTKEVIGNIDSNSIRYLNCVDAGSRQKHTQYDSEFYVDLTGTREDMLSVSDMINWCKASYPRFGNTTFIIDGNSQQSISNIDLTTCFTSDGETGSEIYSIMYGEIVLKSTMQGVIESVPCIRCFDQEQKPMFKVGCFGSANLIFENIVLASDFQIAKASSDYPVFGIEFRNCIIKNYNDNCVVDYENSQFKSVESTILNASDTNTDVVVGSGIAKIEATILGVGGLNLSEDEYNSPILNYVYQIDSNVSEAASVQGNDTYVVGPNCLKDLALSGDKTTFDIKNFEINESIQDNPAINFIPSFYNLILANPTDMFDICGRYRYNEVSKVSLDVGAIESETVDPTSVVYYVSLGNTSEMKYAGRADYISWEDFKTILESTKSFENIYKIYLSGYGLEKKGIVLDGNTSFKYGARLEFYGEKDCVFEGDSFLSIESKYSNVAISGLIARNSKTFIKLSEESNLWATNCLLIGNPDESGATFDVRNNCSVSLYSCSIQTCARHSVFNVDGDITLAMFGCIAQGIDSSSVFGYSGSIITSYEGKLAYHNLTEINASEATEFSIDLLNPDIVSKNILTSEDAKLVNDPYQDRFAIYYEDIHSDSLNELLENGFKYNWLTDIAGNNRALDIHSKKFPADGQDNYINQKKYFAENNLFTSYGCYDSNSSALDNYYDSTPNREITCITEIGRTMITRMLSDTVRFKIEGFAVCSDGYDYNNPVLASKIKVDTRSVIKYAVQPALVSASSATIRLGNFIIYKSEFEGSTIKEVTNKLVAAINTIKYSEGELASSSTFAAYLVDSEAGEFIVERLMPGVNSDELVCSIPNGLLKISSISPTKNVQYDKYQILPTNEFNVFEHIEYLPLAIAMYYRIERGAWSGAFGSEIVYARVVESNNSSELNMLFPLCVCHHGLITKGHDSFIVGRIVLQI